MNSEFELCAQTVVTSIDVTGLGCWEVLDRNHNVTFERVSFRAVVQYLTVLAFWRFCWYFTWTSRRAVSTKGLYRLRIVLRRCQWLSEYRDDGRMSDGRRVRRIWKEAAMT